MGVTSQQLGPVNVSCPDLDLETLGGEVAGVDHREISEVNQVIQPLVENVDRGLGNVQDLLNVACFEGLDRFRLEAPLAASFLEDRGCTEGLAILKLQVGLERRGPDHRSSRVERAAAIGVVVVTSTDGKGQLPPQIDPGLQVSGFDVALLHLADIAAHAQTGSLVDVIPSLAGGEILVGERANVRQSVVCVGTSDHHGGLDRIARKDAPLQVGVGAPTPGRELETHNGCVVKLADTL